MQTARRQRPNRFTLGRDQIFAKVFTKLAQMAGGINESWICLEYRGTRVTRGDTPLSIGYRGVGTGPTDEGSAANVFRQIIVPIVDTREESVSVGGSLVGLDASSPPMATGRAGRGQAAASVIDVIGSGAGGGIGNVGIGGEEGRFTIRVRGSRESNLPEKRFAVGAKDTLVGLMQRYAESAGVARRSMLRFEWDGDSIGDEDTPSSLDMEEGMEEGEDNIVDCFRC